MNTKFIPYRSDKRKHSGFQKKLVARIEKPLRPWVRWSAASAVDKCFIKLATRCWSSLPEARPDMNEAVEELVKCISYLSNGTKVEDAKNEFYEIEREEDNPRKKSKFKDIVSNLPVAEIKKESVMWSHLEVVESKNKEIEVLREAKEANEAKIEELRLKIAKLSNK